MVLTCSRKKSGSTGLFESIGQIVWHSNRIEIISGEIRILISPFFISETWWLGRRRILPLHGRELCRSRLQDSRRSSHCHQAPHIHFIHFRNATHRSHFPLQLARPAPWTTTTAYPEWHSSDGEVNGWVSGNYSPTLQNPAPHTPPQSTLNVDAMRTSVIVCIVMLLKSHLKGLYGLSEE